MLWTVWIKASKTDPYWQGVTIHIGRTGGELCQVAAILGCMVQRGPQTGPFFIFRDGRGLTREQFVSATRSTLTTAGFKAEHYAGHSFRIGAATTTAQKGIQDSLIKTLGRWESEAYTIYIRTPQEVLQGVAGRMVQGVTGRMVQGVAGRIVQGVAGRMVQGVTGRMVQGVAGRIVQGVAGRMVQGVAGRMVQGAERKSD